MRTTSTRILSVLAAGALLVGFSGCGGDDDDDSSEALTLDEFRTQANAICADMNSTLDAAAQEAFGDSAEPPSPEQLADYINNTLIPEVKNTVEGIRGLSAPAEIEDDVHAMLDSVKSSAANLQQQAEDDPSALLTAEEDPFAEANQMADDLGLPDCGTGSEGDATATETTVG